MQTTYYSVMRGSLNHWAEVLPRPRSRQAAIDMAFTIAVDGSTVRVERHVLKHDIVKTFNKARA